MANPNPKNKFQKGHPGLPGAGRPPGATNVLTRDIKTLLREAAANTGFMERVPVLDAAIILRASLIPLPLIAPEPRHAHRRTQLPGFCLLRNRMAGEIALKSPARDAAKAQSYFERALAVARAPRPRCVSSVGLADGYRKTRKQGKRVQHKLCVVSVKYGKKTEGHG